jgi:uncharacterized membrane-anchored protein YhcB (DUF1043 family)
MFTTATLIATALLALCAGLAIGWAMGLRRKSKRDVIIDLETRLERALESRADYEAEVAEHFARTAELLNRMTEDYQQVYSHLASGANKLCEGAIDMPPSSTLLADSSDDLSSEIAGGVQPLDYAPRKSPDEQGQLSETFGLDKTRGEHEETPLSKAG